MRLIPFALQRRWWAVYHTVRHPLCYYAYRRKWRQRPSAGDLVIDCRGRICLVIALGENKDDLYFSDGYQASWMHCCSAAPKVTT